MLSGFLLLALLQTPTAPTGPVVQMFTPAYPSVQLFADGTVVLPALPAGTTLRFPYQDSNDAAMVLNQFGREICGVASPPAACIKYKIVVGK